MTRASAATALALPFNFRWFIDDSLIFAWCGSMRRPAFLISLLLSQWASAAEAGFVSDAWRILTDPFKLDKSTSNLLETVERAAIHAERLEGKVNDDVRKRLDQVDTIVKDALARMDGSIDKVDAVANKALDHINDIQIDIFKNTSQLVKCSTTVSADIVLSKLAGSLNDLGMRRPRVAIFGYDVIEVKFDKSDFDSPIGGFRKYKEMLDRKLASLSPDARASDIIDVYGELQRNADLVRCHYKEDTALFAELYETELEYNRRERAWIGRITP